MKIEEAFVTMSLAEFKYFCKSTALRFQQGYDETEFLIFFEDRKNSMLKQERMTQLTFKTWIQLEEKDDSPA